MHLPYGKPDDYKPQNLWCQFTAWEKMAPVLEAGV
jgi:hypothetical protein